MRPRHRDTANRSTVSIPRVIPQNAAMYEAVANSAEVVAAILGIAVTVVAIVVELAATRFNHRISSHFTREPLNIAVLSFFVLTTLMCVWVSATTTGESGSNALHIATMVMITIALLALLPYFVYVFSFISPINVIRRIKRQAERQMQRCTSHYTPNKRQHAARTIDEIQDVFRSAIDSADRDIAMACVDALTELVGQYSKLRDGLPPEWFEVDDNLRADPDFVSLEASAIARINQDGTWFEFKIFSQLYAAVSLVIPRLRDVANLISIRTRQLALSAEAENDAQLELCLTSFNSYLRTTIREQDPRTAYYVLSQYRLVAEALAERNYHSHVLNITKRLQFYGQLSYQLGQPFILEVCAYDLVQLLEKCLSIDSEDVDPVLDALLELDQEFRSDAQAATLAGVRRAQIRAAAALLAYEDKTRAKRVIDDLATETQLRVGTLISELSNETESEYWELTPRGVNFGYIKPEYRVYLRTIRDALD